MSTLVDTVNTVLYQGGQIIVAMESGVEICFPVAGNSRLAKGTPQQLNHVEVSPYGLHWPDLDEDLSFRGLLEGDYGQDKACQIGCRRRPEACRA
ncbi:MAG: DUF2442 domain-containing protein [Kiritimatiellae bacterium]|nr:DUF2442 domain-containing protein [Verrucomicrobiota bacterium]MCG2659664.1 DUF2442 domain-containing protein [Kiritimatiellia bacterium]